jgi:hypothetical protein
VWRVGSVAINVSHPITSISIRSTGSQSQEQGARVIWERTGGGGCCDGGGGGDDAGEGERIRLV